LAYLFVKTERKCDDSEMATEYRSITPGRDDDGKRIDAVLRRVLEHVPLSGIYRALRSGDVRVNGRKIKPNYRVHPDAAIEVRASLLSGIPDSPRGIRHARAPISADAPGSIAKMIVFDGPHILALNKPSGIPVQGGHRDIETVPLDAQVRDYLSHTIADSLSFRPGPLNRLDRNTSGLVFFSASVEGARRFTSYLRSQECEKLYIALLCGRLSGPVRWDDELVRDEASRRTRIAKPSGSREADGGRPARTAAMPLVISDTVPIRTLALCRITTGRTHQIRAQAAAHGYPLCGDRKYGGADGEISRYFLHAYRYSLPEFDAVLGFHAVSAPISSSQTEQIRRAIGENAVRDALLPERLETAAMKLALL
jgi:23S rRNA pseudouridine955/2504/2580 synthase